VVLEFQESGFSGISSSHKSVHRQNVFAVTLALRAKELRAALEMCSRDSHPWLVRLSKDFEQRFGIGRDVAKLCDVVAQTTAYGFFMSRAASAEKCFFSRAVAFDILLRAGFVPRVIFSPFQDGDVPESVQRSIDAIVESLSGFVFSQCPEASSIYFYESFLAAYSPHERNQFGVYYTPQELVEFIVRGAHGMCGEIGIENGIANRKCRIVDPACGSGSFLLSAKTFLEKQNSLFEKSRALDADVSFQESLRTRLVGFEIMPAAYLAAHFHLALAAGFYERAEDLEKRFSVFLSDTLEATSRLCEALSVDFQTTEERATAAMKSSSFVPVVVGNPPYRQFSDNKNPWIEGLMRTYKEGLVERKHNVDNDYIKFIRFAQHLVEQAGGGVVAFVTPNAFLDAPTLRVMRKSLLASFDFVKIVNLHGSCTVDNGVAGDENIFGIRQGVCVFFLGKKQENSGKETVAKVSYAEILGSREHKLHLLAQSSLNELNWVDIDVKSDNSELVPRLNCLDWHDYGEFVSISDVFRVKSSGIQTKNDSFVVAKTREELIERMRNLVEWDDGALQDFYPSLKDSSGWNIKDARKHAELLRGRMESVIHPVLYRPFDVRYTVVTNFGNGIVGRPRFDVMKNLLHDSLNSNFALITTRQLSSSYFDHAFVAGIPVDGNAISQRSREYNVVFPLFVEDGMYGYVHNFQPRFVEQIELSTKLEFSENARREASQKFDASDLFGYVYAVLSSHFYRKQYFEFMKRDFPRIPVNVDAESFRTMATLGMELANLHRNWMDVDPCSWHGGERCLAGDLVYDSSTSRLYVNSQEYFDDVSAPVLDVRVGAFPVVKKWISERTKADPSRELVRADLVAFGRVLRVLCATVDLTSKIDVCFYPSASSRMPFSMRSRSSSETQEMV
jgi:predicted helicase